MPSTKVRGKSAVLVNDSISNTPLSVPNLLKIESVAPTLTVRNKIIRRSHSTLNSTYLKKLNENNKKNGNKIEAENFNEKSSNSNPYNSIQQNGICRIKRTPKEKDKLPDRINLDRKGLTAIPYIEEEPNLRLLSLQHNLINKFHVPYENLKNNNNNTSTTSCTNLTPSNIDFMSNTNEIKPPNKNDLLHRENSAINLNKQFPKQQQQQLSQKQSNRNLLVNNLNLIGNNNYIVNNPTVVQKSLVLNVNHRNMFKKSNSVMCNQSPIHATQNGVLNINKTILEKPITKSKLNHMQSISSDIFSCSITASPEIIGRTPTLIPTENDLSSHFGFSNSLQNLVFLDLYDNQIDRISNLDGLKNLTVLLLGKNRITDISGIVSLKNSLRVLDLHGNKISSINQKVCQLQELKSLNLAGNLLRHISSGDFNGLFSLKELNLKRNRLKKLSGFNDLRSLERLWLCHNDLQHVEDMSCIAKAFNLKEVTIENNPVSLAGDCVSFIVSYLPNLMSLSQMQVTEQVRRAANAWRKNKEVSDSNYLSLTTDVSNSIRREEVISNARTNWELLRSQQQPTNKNPLISQKTTTTTTTTSIQQQVTIREIEVDVYSNISENVSTQKRSVRQKNVTHKETIKNGKKIMRSSSQENIMQIKGEQAVDEFFRLPPILAPFLDQNYSAQKISSASSLGPNVDSSSSCYSSDNEDINKLLSEMQEDEIYKHNNKCEQKVPIKNQKKIDNKNETKFTIKSDTKCDEQIKKINLNYDINFKEVLESNTANTIVETIKVNDDAGKQLDAVAFYPKIVTSECSTSVSTEISSTTSTEMYNKSFTQNKNNNLNENFSQLDKVSNISTNSVKTSSESLLTNSSSDENRQKIRSANNNRRCTGGSLIRAQTARTNCIPVTATVITNCSISNNLTSSNNNNNINNNYINNINNSIIKQAKNQTDREREQGGDYLIEICGRYLNVYGVGALKFIDKQWNTQKANDVHTVKFSYINFNSIASILYRVKVRFINAENFIFRETNIHCLGQLNALAEVQGINSLIIDSEGNPLCTKNWNSYAIYRLSHWGLKQINGIDVTEEDIQFAEKTYSGLSDLVLWSLPETLLQPLLARLRLDESCLASKMSAKDWLIKADPSLKSVVGKEALQWKKNGMLHEELAVRHKGRSYFQLMMENTCNAVEKLQKLESLWPSMLVEMIRNTLLDYSQIDVYVKNLMTEIIANK